MQQLLIYNFPILNKTKNIQKTKNTIRKIKIKLNKYNKKNPNKMLSNVD